MGETKFGYIFILPESVLHNKMSFLDTNYFDTISLFYLGTYVTGTQNIRKTF